MWNSNNFIENTTSISHILLHLTGYIDLTFKTFFQAKVETIVDLTNLIKAVVEPMRLSSIDLIASTDVSFGSTSFTENTVIFKVNIYILLWNKYKYTHDYTFITFGTMVIYKVHDVWSVY